MVSYLFGLESMAYLTCGLVDRGVEDYSLESAICKVSPAPSSSGTPPTGRCSCAAARAT